MKRNFVLPVLLLVTMASLIACAPAAGPAAPVNDTAGPAGYSKIKVDVLGNVFIAGNATAGTYQFVKITDVTAATKVASRIGSQAIFAYSYEGAQLVLQGILLPASVAWLSVSGGLQDLAEGPMNLNGAVTWRNPVIVRIVTGTDATAVQREAEGSSGSTDSRCRPRGTLKSDGRLRFPSTGSSPKDYGYAVKKWSDLSDDVFRRFFGVGKNENLIGVAAGQVADANPQLFNSYFSPGDIERWKAFARFFNMGSPPMCNSEEEEYVPMPNFGQQGQMNIK